MSNENTGGLFCHECGSTDVKATSAEQVRKVHGKDHHVADMVCNACGHGWWSSTKEAIALSRAADKARIQHEEEEHKKIVD